jgi:hypothetical protein
MNPRNLIAIAVPRSAAFRRIATSLEGSPRQIGWAIDVAGGSCGARERTSVPKSDNQLSIRNRRFSGYSTELLRAGNTAD